MKLKKLLLYFICVSSALTQGGFRAGTLVKKADGSYSAIENIRVGDHVTSFNFEGACVEDVVQNVKSEHINHFLEIVIGDEKLVVAADHKYYLPAQKSASEKWVKAEELELGQLLLRNCTELVAIDGITSLDQEDVAYDLTIRDNHNFCVSRQDVTVHNIAIPLLAWGGGQGLAFVGWPAVGKAVAAGLAGWGLSYFARKMGAPIDIEFDEEAFKASYAGDEPPDFYESFKSSSKSSSAAGGGGEPPKEPRRAPPIIYLPSPNDNLDKKSESNNLYKQTKNQLIRSRNKYEKRFKEHTQKLEDYKRDPYAYDNLGLLKNARNQKERDNVFNTRVEHLTKEIDNFSNQMKLAQELIEQKK